MAKKSTLTPRNYLVLAMLDRQPQTGYQLCKQIEAMPIGGLSASPGSIYPNLKKLLSQGYVVAKVFGGSEKPRRLYRPSAKGKRVLARWLGEPITAATAIRSPETLFVKFSFSQSGKGLPAEQLDQLNSDLEKRLEELQSFQHAALRDMNEGGQLAVDLSVKITKTLYEWTRDAAKSKRK